MSDRVISLSSSDEEDSVEPPRRKLKATPNLPECTLTLVSSPKSAEDARQAIETVSLDSDDEICKGKDDLLKKNSETTISNIEKPSNIVNVDLISLTDDEEDTQLRVNGTINSVNNTNVTKNNCKQINQVTSISIDDSDSELKTSTEIETAANNSDTDVEKTEEDKEKNTQSIIIDDSDDETEKENHCENEPIGTFPVQIEKTSAIDISSASTSKDEMAEAKMLFRKFIQVVEEKIVDSCFEEILPKKAPIIRKYFNRSGTYINDTAFKHLLMESINTMRKSSTANGANSAVLAFHKIFEHLKSHVAETTIVVEEEHIPKIKKLEQTIKLLRKRIHQLEVAEVDFEDDEDSAYIMLDRYQNRLNKVYAKYCQYINKNPYSGRATHDRITFVNSSYNEINQAITRKYKNSLVFPSYFDLENYIKKVVKKQKLNLSETEIKIESKKCFKTLGNILQKKRRQELYDSHLDFVESTEDPASKDISLENVLKKNYVEGKEKIEKLYQRYVNKQEKGEDHISSGDDSSEESDVEDNKDKKGKIKKNCKVKAKRKGKGAAGEAKDNTNETDTQKEKAENERKEENNRSREKVSSEKVDDEQNEDFQKNNIKEQNDEGLENDKTQFLSILNVRPNEANKEDI